MVVEKGELSWHGASSDGRRKGSELCCDLLDLMSPLRAGRIVVDVGIFALNDQLRLLTSLTKLEAHEVSKSFETC